MRKLGEILIEHGSIVPDQLEKALLKQKSEKEKRLGQILIELGFVTEEDIVVALATQFNYAYLPLENFTPNPDACEAISKDLVVRYSFLPVDKAGDTISITMSDPSDETAVREIEKVTGHKIQVFVSTSTEIDRAIRKYFSDERPSDKKPTKK